MIIESYYQNMVLSAAAYANLNPGMDLDTYIDALKDVPAFAPFSYSELEAFANRYNIVDVYQDENQIPGSGLAVTVFYDTVEHKHIMAVRGTDFEISGVNDIVGADVADIGLNGVAIHQGVDLYNYYLRLITPINETVVQYEYIEPIEVILGLKVEIIPRWMPFPSQSTGSSTARYSMSRTMPWRTKPLAGSSQVVC